MKAKDKAIKLLKLAQDQEGTPEGDSARSRAESIIEKHGLILEETDLEDESQRRPERVFFEQHEERVDWKEMLLVTLCDVAHGGVVVPFWGLDGEWQLWVLVDDIVDIPLLRQHYQYLCNHVERLLDWKHTATVKHPDPEKQKHRVNSFALGVMAYIGETLVRILDEEGVDMDFDDLPFVYKPNTALQAASEEDITQETHSEPPTNDLPALFDSFADQVQNAQQIFQEKLPAPYEEQPPAPEPAPEENIEILEPSWGDFDQGKRMASYHVQQDVFPPDPEEDP